MNKRDRFRFAIVKSEFNEEVTGGLYRGAVKTLHEMGHEFKDRDLYLAPGAFEIPLIAKELAKTGLFDGVIGLGCVIKGDTAHFEFISLGAAIGTMHASLDEGVPIAFGVLTTYTDEQAVARSRDDHENKGREAALACLKSAELLRRIRSQTPGGVEV